MDTPCDGCRPELERINEPYFHLYYYVQGQYIMGRHGPVALNLLAIHQAMEDHNVDKDERVEFSIMVRRIANIIISAQAEELEEQMRKANKK